MKRIRVVPFLFCFGLLTHAGMAYAGHPLGTEDAGTVGKGNAEVEFNYERTHAEMGSRVTSIGNIYTLGLAPNLDLGVAFAYVFLKPDAMSDTVRGMGDTEATLKTSFPDGKGWVPTVGVKAGIRLPTGDRSRGFGEGRSTGLFTVIADWEIDRLKIHGNVGNTFNGHPVDVQERQVHLKASAAAEWEFKERWALVGEYLWERGHHPPVSDDSQALVGIRKELLEGVLLDAGIRWGLNAASENVTYLAGLTLSFNGGKAGDNH